MPEFLVALATITVLSLLSCYPASKIEKRLFVWIRGKISPLKDIPKDTGEIILVGYICFTGDNNRLLSAHDRRVLERIITSHSH